MFAGLGAGLLIGACSADGAEFEMVEALGAEENTSERQQEWSIGHTYDSFAPGHTSRQSDNTNLRDICSYKRPVAGVCDHGGDPDGYPQDLVALYPTLAQKASSSTAGDHRAVWQLFGNSSICSNENADCETAVRKALQPFFDNEVDEYTGKFQCTFLPNQPTVSWRCVGTRTGADKIAGCENGPVYALHGNKTLYKNSSGGTTGGWVFPGSIHGPPGESGAPSRPGL